MKIFSTGSGPGSSKRAVPCSVFVVLCRHMGAGHPCPAPCPPTPRPRPAHAALLLVLYLLEVAQLTQHPRSLSHSLCYAPFLSFSLGSRPPWTMGSSSAIAVSSAPPLFTLSNMHHRLRLLLPFAWRPLGRVGDRRSSPDVGPSQQQPRALVARPWRSLPSEDERSLGSMWALARPHATTSPPVSPSPASLMPSASGPLLCVREEEEGGRGLE